ncbi:MULTISPECIES: hypothetical protein [unclassified Rathayibacter]|uniref:hypothetical protein n=1 Tax=unclassified Rathayibacter TaxID=2609250 RepID=UPI000CE7C476|nr:MULTISPECIES: hypothetical protein [unclassified Rathayibacter]PPG55767.1 hypothetical protein C5C57_16595 [Rathayibacter sp. AY1C5]PPH74545.1 hypothetical protein C5C90_10655 [Rathayibacter sp. AY1D4]
MTGPNITGDDYRAGYLAGQADRQGEVDWLENEADRLYRLAYGDERRVQDLTVTRAELEQRRALSEPPVEVTRRDALASWGIETPPHRHPRGRGREREPVDADGTHQPHEQESQ